MNGGEREGAHSNGTGNGREWTYTERRRKGNSLKWKIREGNGLKRNREWNGLDLSGMEQKGTL